MVTYLASSWNVPLAVVLVLLSVNTVGIEPNYAVDVYQVGQVAVQGTDNKIYQKWNYHP